jgi:spore germination protein KC
MKRNNKGFCSVIITVLLLLSGCGNVLEVDRVAVPLGTGCELAASGDLLEFTAQFSVPASSTEQGSANNITLVLTSTGKTVSEASRKLSHILPHTPLFTHVQSFVIGERLAQDDVALLADFRSRNPEARETTLLFVSKGSSPDEILNTATPIEPSSGAGLANMIKLQEQQIGIYQPVEFGDFFTKLTKSGIEPVCPQVTIEKNGDKNYLKLAGTAVFKKDRMVGELSESESQAFRILNPAGVEGGLLIVKWDEDTLVTMENIRIRTKSTALIDKKGQLKMKLELKGEGNFYEQTSPVNILTISGVKDLNRKTEQQIKKDLIQCIKKIQLIGSDIFGWGLIFKQQYPAAWDDMRSDWPHYFAQIEPEIDVSFETRRTYLLDQSFTINH